jgi:N,N'-diacetyllegionaminate synthase
MAKAVEIAGRELCKYRDVFIIAEVASSHEGDPEIAIRLLQSAAEAGADAVKFQVFSAHQLLVPEHPKFHSFTEIEMTPSEWRRIYRACASTGIPFVAEVFDEESLHLMQELGVSTYKIHSTDLTNPLFIEKVASTGKPLLLSTGGSIFEEIRYAIGVAEAKSNNNIILMHGFQAFPTRLEDTHLWNIPKLEHEFSYPVGYADHCEGGTEYALALPLVAIGMGACVIEKHITLDRSLKGRDYYSALNPEEFAHMVSLIRNVEYAFGLSKNDLSEAEMKYRHLMKKTIVSALPLTQGQEITKEVLAFKRSPEFGTQPAEYLKFIGRKTKRKIAQNELILEGDLV